ncbi:hypothetical protein [Fluviispira vulneris]|uniref:hypothetical protein n=1 Tax=Fluviispira vulneris TaxID=2763012 RepID=UPI001648462A|nr:hypothetical protein [Fluviispira vulneris]
MKATKMFNNKVYLSMVFIFFTSNENAYSIEEEANEYEIPYPKENRQNLFASNSYQEFNTHNGFYLEEGFKISKYGDSYIPIFSTQIGININNSFQLYGGAFYLFNKPTINYKIQNTEEKVSILNFSTLNIGASYTPFGTYYIHPKLGIDYGRTQLSLLNTATNLPVQFDSISPSLYLESNIWKYLNFSIGIQYRYIFNNERLISESNIEYIVKISLGNF